MRAATQRLSSAAQRLSAAKRVLAITGAGTSTSAGLPDFRTPGTGLYATLEEYDLPQPEAVFDLAFYKHNPKPFCRLAKELLPADVHPTPAHLFLKALADKGKLLRCYTQNIDGLERRAGIPADLLVEAHGSFASASCTACAAPQEHERVRADLERGRVPACAACGGLAKPDIVFFGEQLPDRFHDLVGEDTHSADLFLVMGTSLQVHPVAGMLHDRPRMPGGGPPALVLNNEPLDGADRPGDETIVGDIDGSVQALGAELGW